MTNRFKSAATCSLLGLAIATEAMAQTPPPASLPADPPAVGVPLTPGTEPQTGQDAAAPAAADSDTGLADIVVTAQKRSENLQRVPAAVSVVPAEKLTALGVTSLTQLPNLTTGLSITPVRTQAFTFIRGVGQTVTSPNADPSVATNLNGVYIPAEVAGTSFFDVDRVEILPGPQGTLYGRNAAGGVVNLAGRLPGSTVAVDGFVEIGNYDRRQIVVGVDLPFDERFAVRIAGTVVRHDGYASNGLDDERTSALKGAVVWRPGDTTTITATATWTHGGGLGNTLESTPPQYGCGTRCATFDPKALGYFFDSDAVLSTWQVEQELSDDILFTYVGGYVTLDLKSSNTIFTGPPLAPLTLNQEIESVSHEARINASVGAFDAVLGLYYFTQEAEYFQRISPNAPAFSVNPFSAESEGYAVFGQGTFSITDALRLTGGLRYSDTSKSIDGFNSDFNAAGSLVRLLPFTGRNSLRRLDYKAGIEFDATDDVLLYANFSTGFNTGGFSAAQVVAGPAISPAAPFEEVTLKAWSGGFKTKFLDGRATLNAEGFYYDYSNYQVAARALNGQLTIFNAQKATIYGVQADARFRPSRFDDLTVGVTYLDAVADILRAGGVNYDGFELPYAPKWTANASYQRSFDVGRGAQLRGLVNFKYVSSRFALYTQQRGSDIEANTNTSVNFGYYAEDDRWSVSVWGRNLENNLVRTSCGNALPRPPAGDGTGCFYEPPRTYGAAIGFKF